MYEGLSGTAEAVPFPNHFGRQILSANRKVLEHFLQRRFVRHVKRRFRAVDLPQSVHTTLFPDRLR